jgi:hypothetical protein
MWLIPEHSLSPLQTVDLMTRGTRVTAISGANDPIALPQYARSYVAKASARGIPASMLTIPGRGHEILNDPLVIEAVAKAVSQVDCKILHCGPYVPHGTDIFPEELATRLMEREPYSRHEIHRTTHSG